MQISFTPRENPLVRMGGSAQRHQQRMEQRQVAREREMRIREAEDLRISRLRDEMELVRSSEMESDLKNVALRGLASQISEIMQQRAERERLAIEAELKQKKADMEERRRENEERADEARVNNATDEELEQLRQESFTRGMVTMAARADNISGLRRTRATLAAEAEQLSQDIRNSYSPVVVHDFNDLVANFDDTVGSGAPIDPTVWMNTGHANPNDFRNRQLTALRGGIARLDTAVLAETAGMYRDSKALQERQLRLAGETPEIDEEL
jgi:hypothetical protein